MIRARTIVYFGDRIGSPGTILTFFPWPGARRGSRGAGQVVAASFAVPNEALGFWRDRLKTHSVPFEDERVRFNEPVIRFADPDGLLLELIGTDQINDAARTNWEGGVSGQNAVRGFHAPTCELRQADLTAQLLTDLFGFELVAEEGSRRRFSAGSAPNQWLDLVERPGGGFGHIAAGTVHHIAFRAATEEEQQEWRRKLADLGLNVTPVVDRQYFHSIYFREPGGVLFEIATDAPGFATDEPVEHLGENLQLPPQFEPHRSAIAQSLPPIHLPQHSVV